MQIRVYQLVRRLDNAQAITGNRSANNALPVYLARKGEELTDAQVQSLARTVTLAEEEATDYNVPNI